MLILVMSLNVSHSPYENLMIYSEISQLCPAEALLDSYCGAFVKTREIKAYEADFTAVHIYIYIYIYIYIQ